MLACERCIDIHKAQSAGATQNKCRCECHNNKGTVDDYPATTWLNMTTAGTGDTITNTAGFGSVTLNSDGTFT